MKLLPLSLAKAFAQRGSLSTPAFLSRIREQFGLIQNRYRDQKPHPFIWIVLVIALVCTCLHYWVLPSVRDLESKLALRPAQWAQLENLIRLSKTNALQVSGIEPMDEAELQKIRIILSAKGIKPSLLRMTLENPPRVELQMSDVLFSNAVDALEELRKTWNLHPEQIEVGATPKIAVVNLKASLRQMGAVASIAGEQSR